MRELTTCLGNYLIENWNVMRAIYSYCMPAGRVPCLAAQNLKGTFWVCLQREPYDLGGMIRCLVQKGCSKGCIPKGTQRYGYRSWGALNPLNSLLKSVV